MNLTRSFSFELPTRIEYGPGAFSNLALELSRLELGESWLRDSRIGPRCAGRDIGQKHIDTEQSAAYG